MSKGRKLLAAMVSCVLAVTQFTACDFLLTSKQIHEHDYEKKETVAATCTKKGYITYACECGEEYAADTAMALGHNFSNCILDKNGAVTGTCKRKECQQTLAMEETAADIFKVEGNTLTGLTDDAANRYSVLYIPNKIGDVEITSIGNGAFRKNEALVEVVIPDGVTTIGEQAFASCAKLTYVGISKDVTEIKPWTFFDSKKLTNITFFGEQEAWDNVKKGTYWNNLVPIENVMCTESDLYLLSEMKINQKEVLGTRSADSDYIYNKTLKTFTNISEEKSKGFYPLRTTEDYIVRVQMGASSGESDFIIYASESSYITIRTGVDNHSNEMLYIQTNGVWNTETRVGYDLSTFINLDGNSGMLDFTVVRYQGGFYLYVCDYVNEETGNAEKYSHWKLIFSCLTGGDADDSRFETLTQDAWGNRQENGGVRSDLKQGIQGVCEAFENGFAVYNKTSRDGQWKITLDDIDENAAAFVANPFVVN